MNLKVATPIILFLALVLACQKPEVTQDTDAQDIEQQDPEQQDPTSEQDTTSGQDPEPSVDPPLDTIPGTVIDTIPNPNPGPQDPYDSLVVLNAGAKRPESTQPITPGYPDSLHVVEYFDFYNPSQDYLDEYENTDYVCAQGGGTAFPILTSDYYIRFYQGTNAKNGGSYIKVRSHNGAKIQELEVGTNTKTQLAHSLNGKAAKSATTSLSAGDHYVITPTDVCDQITIYCMGTSKDERWEMNYIKLTYKGGFVAEDYLRPEKEYGPLVQLPQSFIEDFETGFPEQGAKPSYYKYSQTDVGRENLQWSTWYGSISWQQPIQGNQSAQLRTYQKEEDYEYSQYGYLKTEFFVKDLKTVEFDYVMTDYFMRAEISYCLFGTSTWLSPAEIRLPNYSDRDKLQHFTYLLDNGVPHDAKIKIEISTNTSFPSKDHSDLKIDNVRFL